MKVKVQVATTPEALTKGLMYREHLDSDEGMLFVFPRTHVLSFWGENTFIPLDIAFVDHQHKIAKIGRIETLSRKGVSSEVPCKMAVEVNAGFFDQFGIKVGDRIKVSEDKFDGPVIEFEKNAGETEKPVEASKKDSGSKEVTARRRRILDMPGQIMLPFMYGDPATRAIDDSNKPQEEVSADQPNPQVPVENQVEGDLPQISLDDVRFVDDDEPTDQDMMVEFDGNGNPVKPQEPPQQPPITEEQPEQEPDASTMSNDEAIQEAIKNNRVMWIWYVTKPVKQKVGGWKGNFSIVRLVEPHGVFHARTTGNNILVVFDREAGDIRAFIIDRIKDKAFIGQRFKKRFVVTH